MAGAGRPHPEEPALSETPDAANPVTLIDLLRKLERSADLRPLARDCGLSVRELRRRLRRWSQEMQQELEEDGGGAAAGGTAAAGNVGTAVADEAPGTGPTGRRQAERAQEWPRLAAAAGLRSSPLPADGSRVLEAWTDGASRGNPGPAAIGIVFRQQGGEALAEHAEAIGRATNNEAEYRAVIRALELCVRWRVARLDLHVDSELVARQLRGVYRVKSASLRPLYQQAAHLARQLRQFRVRHVPRERNRHADHLASRALREAGA